MVVLVDYVNNFIGFVNIDKQNSIESFELCTVHVESRQYFTIAHGHFNHIEFTFTIAFLTTIAVVYYERISYSCQTSCFSGHTISFA